MGRLALIDPEKTNILSTRGQLPLVRAEGRHSFGTRVVIPTDRSRALASPCTEVAAPSCDVHRPVTMITPATGTSRAARTAGSPTRLPGRGATE
jgi:hypothetical protein